MCEDEDRWSFGDPCFIYHGKIIPQDFPYVCILVQGRPRHHKDAFSCRHPQMERGKRAKILAPFDALDGYSDMIAEEERVTEERMALGEHELEMLNQKLNLIAEMVDAGERPDVTFTVFVPDERKDGGKYVVVRDTVKRVDMVEKIVVLMSTQGYGRVNRTIEIDKICSIHGGLVDDIYEL